MTALKQPGAMRNQKKCENVNSDFAPPRFFGQKLQFLARRWEDTET
jgi:hypothetical protein